MTTKTTKQIETAIKSIAQRGATLQQDIQDTGLDVLAHIDQHGEVSLLNKLFLALPVGQRRDSFVVWATSFGKCSINSHKETRETRPFIFSKIAETDLEGAAQMKWYEAKRAADPLDVFDVSKALAGILKKVSKAQQEGRKITGLDSMQAQIDLITKLQQPTEVQA